MKSWIIFPIVENVGKLSTTSMEGQASQNKNKWASHFSLEIHINEKLHEYKDIDHSKMRYVQGYSLQHYL